MALQRRKPLRSGKPLRAKSGFTPKPLSAAKRTAARPDKRPIPKSGVPLGRKSDSRAARRSRKRPVMSAQERRCREIVAERSGGLCEICGRRGRLEKAHRLARSQQGAWDPSNILDLCSGCHQWNHAHPVHSCDEANGWHLPSGSDPIQCPVKVFDPDKVRPEHFDDEFRTTPLTAPTRLAMLDDDGNVSWVDQALDTGRP